MAVLPGFLARNKALKILSLFLALALWFAVGGEERTEVTLNVPLELSNLNPDLMVASEVPPALQVRIAGPRSIVRSISQTRYVHTLDLSGLKAGVQTFSLGPNSFSFPRGVQVSRVQPNSISLTLAATLSRTLPVQPVLSGAPPEGFELKSVKISPGQVTVRGPASELNGLNFIPTLPIFLSNLTGSTTLPTDLDFKNLHLTLQTPATLNAEIVMLPKTLKRTVSGVQVTPTHQPARLSPAKVAVTVEGPFSLVKDLKREDIKASVDTRNLKPGRHRLKVAVTLPQDLKVLLLEPDAVTAHLGK